MIDILSVVYGSLVGVLVTNIYRDIKERKK